MKKQEINKFGKHYLLGIRKEDNQKIWLADFEWACDWYWGGGYLHAFTNNNNPTASRDISEHFHWDSSVKDSNKNAFDWFMSYFSESVLTENKVWQLCDLMKSFYTFREVAEIYHTGNSHYTSNTGIDLSDKVQEDRINQEIIAKKIIPAIRNLLEP